MIDREMVQERPEEGANENSWWWWWDVLGCQKAKHSPLVIHHDSLLFTIHLGALRGSHQQELNAKGRTGLPTYMYLK